MANASGAAGDQQTLVGHLATRENTAVRGHGGNPQAGADAEADGIGQGRHPAAINCDLLGGGAKAARVLRLVHPHPLADTRRVDVLTDSVDDARAIAVRNDVSIAEQFGHRTSPFLDVGWVDPAGA